MSQNKVIIALGTNVGNWKNNFNQAFININKLGHITIFLQFMCQNHMGIVIKIFFTIQR